MASLNMTNMSTLFRKGYLFAGVIMAANIFVVNEMKAMNSAPSAQTEYQAMSPEINQPNTYPNHNDSNINQNFQEINIKGENSDASWTQYVQLFLKKLLSQNGLTLIGGAVFSVANNYLKWWDYNPGWYRQFGCVGWRSKRFLNGVLQFEANFNLGRGIGWSIANIICVIRVKRSKKNGESVTIYWGGFFSNILRGFTSMPLTFHISNFSISVSLDSIIWWGIIDNILIQAIETKKANTDKNEENIEDLKYPEEIHIDINSNNKENELEASSEDSNY